MSENLIWDVAPYLAPPVKSGMIYNTSEPRPIVAMSVAGPEYLIADNDAG